MVLVEPIIQMVFTFREMLGLLIWSVVPEAEQGMEGGARVVSTLPATPSR